MPIIYEKVFGKSPERAVTAAKKPTQVGCSLWDITRSKRIEDTTIPVGTTIEVDADIWEKTNGLSPLNGKLLKLYHRLNTGTPELLDQATSVPPNDGGLGAGWVRWNYTITQAGKHTFYVVFDGDAVYKGCQAGEKTFAR